VGVELSMQALLGNWRIDLTTAFLDSELGDFPDVVDPTVPPTIPPTLVNLTGGTAPFAPEVSVNVGASYDFELASGLLVTPRVDVSYVSDQNGAVFESPRTLIPERTLVNAAARFDMGDTSPASRTSATSGTRARRASMVCGRAGPSSPPPTTGSPSGTGAPIALGSMENPVSGLVRNRRPADGVMSASARRTAGLKPQPALPRNG
jgi:hypothetical protein